MSEGSAQMERKRRMDSMILFVGFILFYLAMQLWILPRFGIST